MIIVVIIIAVIHQYNSSLRRGRSGRGKRGANGSASDAEVRSPELPIAHARERVLRAQSCEIQRLDYIVMYYSII